MGTGISSEILTQRREGAKTQRAVLNLGAARVPARQRMKNKFNHGASGQHSAANHL